MYRTEADFVRSLSARLKQFGFDVNRIESHGTANGIPDMFIQGHGLDFWIEAKNKKLVWRPGQVAWHYNYFLNHRRSKCVLTLIAAKLHLIIIPGIKVWQNNKPDWSWEIEWSILEKLNWLILFDCLTTVERHTSYRDAIIAIATKYYPLDLDYDPEAIWPGPEVDDIYDTLTFEQHKCEVLLTLNTIYRNQYMS